MEKNILDGAITATKKDILPDFAKMSEKKKYNVLCRKLYCTILYKPKLRYMQVDESDHLDSLGSTISNKEQKQIKIMSSSQPTTAWNKEKKREVFKKPTNVVDNYVNYINGDEAQPTKLLNEYEPTLISLMRQEKTRNKPLLECKIGIEIVKRGSIQDQIEMSLAGSWLKTL